MSDAHESFNYSQITEHIFLGTNACCKAHFDENLGAQGITADISLEKEKLDNPMGVDYFLWLPTADLEAPTHEQLALGVQTLHFFIDNNIKVYVHCRLGHGRSTTLVMAYLMSIGKSYDDACAIVKERRPEVHLEEAQTKALNEMWVRVAKHRK